MKSIVKDSPYIYIMMVMLIMTFIFAGCKKEFSVSDWQKVTTKKWVHSHEDDPGDNIYAYRQSSYDFPPSRGRRGFSLLENNIFINYEIAPADGIIERKGTWKINEDGSCAVSFPDAPERNFTIEVVSYRKSMLKIKTINN